MLRQDPDVILVGEMRDLETISTALTAAETGHLVFATLHTQDAPQSIDRIIDVFPAHQQQQVRVQLASALQGICTQQLSRPRTARVASWRARCMVATPAIRNLIREGKTHQIYSMLQAGGRYGMVTMDMSLAQLVQARDDQPCDMALERCHDEEDLRRLDGTATSRTRDRRCPRPSATRSATRPASSSRARSKPTAQTLVVSKLRSMGYVPIEIEQQKQGRAIEDQDPALRTGSS